MAIGPSRLTYLLELFYFMYCIHPRYQNYILNTIICLHIVHTRYYSFDMHYSGENDKKINPIVAFLPLLQ